jgi:hypothetical protein
VRCEDGFFEGVIPDFSALDLVFFGEETGVGVWDALLEMMAVRGSTAAAAGAAAECKRARLITRVQGCGRGCCCYSRRRDNCRCGGVLTRHG